MSNEPSQQPEERNESAGPEELLEQPEATTVSLQAELEEERREKSQFRSLLQRVQADFVNYKRRVEEERLEQQNQAKSWLLLKLLPIVDDLRRALENVPANQAQQPWGEGVALIQRKLEALLESEGVSPIEVEGQPFDPLEHEALLYQESDEHHGNQVISVVRRGYRLHGKVLRPAQVVVAKGKQSGADLGDASLQESDDIRERER